MPAMLHRQISNLKLKLAVSTPEIAELLDYVAQDCPAPPPSIVKREILKHYAARSGVRVFIETGTFMGETVRRLSPFFDLLYTIELSEPIYRGTSKRLAKFKNIRPIFGSSAEWLPKILSDLQQPALIWLDAHASGGDTAGPEHDPLIKELETIFEFRNAGHLILIDDARGLGVSTTHLKELAAKFAPSHHFTISQDLIRIVPNKYPRIGQPL